MQVFECNKNTELSKKNKSKRQVLKVKNEFFFGSCFGEFLALSPIKKSWGNIDALVSSLFG